MAYIENPKTKGSGIICCIPQNSICPNKCKDCFFQSGRSYLEPLDKNLPNIPWDWINKVVRINDGNDSNVEREVVEEASRHFSKYFFNTSINKDIEKFPGPVVLTINPGNMTDLDFHKIEDPPPNLMFVRFRTNTWNLSICDGAVDWYSDREVPIVLTFMAYHKEKDVVHKPCYHYRKRTLNEYYVISFEAWHATMDRYKTNKWVYSCGREGIASQCRFCGNCLREYFATMERIRCTKQ